MTAGAWIDAFRASCLLVRWRALLLPASLALVLLPPVARWRLPVPLNEAGATTAALSFVAITLALSVVAATAHEVPHLESFGRKGHLVRLLTVVRIAGVLGMLAVGGVLVGHGIEASRLALTVGFLVGVGLLARRAARVPWWLVPLAVWATFLVFGVDRQELRPRAWAWMLRDTLTLSGSEVLPSLGCFVAGAVAFIVVRACTSSLDDLE